MRSVRVPKMPKKDLITFFPRPFEIRTAAYVADRLKLARRPVVRPHVREDHFQRSGNREMDLLVTGSR